MRTSRERSAATGLGPARDHDALESRPRSLGDSQGIGRVDQGPGSTPVWKDRRRGSCDPAPAPAARSARGRCRNFRERRRRYRPPAGFLARPASWAPSRLSRIATVLPFSSTHQHEDRAEHRCRRVQRAASRRGWDGPRQQVERQVHVIPASNDAPRRHPSLVNASSLLSASG